jgi:hypothetical protein
MNVNVYINVILDIRDQLCTWMEYPSKIKFKTYILTAVIGQLQKAYYSDLGRC